MRFDVKTLFQYGGNARFAEAGFARDQHDLALPRLGARPTARQQVDLLIAANQPAQGGPTQRLEPAHYGARTQHLPGWHRLGDALHLDGAEIAIFEKISDQPARARSYEDRVWFCQSLQTGGKVRRFADD